jgi:carbohydrate-binding DOMON domain-containing protein
VNNRWKVLAALGCVLWLTAGAAWAGEVSFTDPTGDDNGPGSYVYPTDTVYKQGSFDLTGLKVKWDDKKVNFDVSVNSTLEDPWGMKVGFAVQMFFIFIDTDGKAGSGFTEGLPGLNVQFAPASAWDKVVVLSPQGAARVKSEAETKAAAMLSGIVVPGRTKGAGRTVSGSVDLAELGGGDPSTWGYQVVVQSNEGFPDSKDLLTRKVNEYEGQHRFGGGNDGDCDPHVMDILAGAVSQAEQLKYECAADGSAKTKATLQTVRK